MRGETRGELEQQSGDGLGHGPRVVEPKLAIELEGSLPVSRTIVRRCRRDRTEQQAQDEAHPLARRAPLRRHVAEGHRSSSRRHISPTS